MAKKGPERQLLSRVRVETVRATGPPAGRKIVVGVVRRVAGGINPPFVLSHPGFLLSDHGIIIARMRVRGNRRSRTFIRMGAFHKSG